MDSILDKLGMIEIHAPAWGGVLEIIYTWGFHVICVLGIFVIITKYVFNEKRFSSH